MAGIRQLARKQLANLRHIKAVSAVASKWVRGVLEVVKRMA